MGSNTTKLCSSGVIGFDLEAQASLDPSIIDAPASDPPPPQYKNRVRKAEELC